MITGNSVNKLQWFGIGLAVLFSLVYICSINYISFPWRDEIGTSDTSINVLKYGKWMSDVWRYSYNPLHAILLIGWLAAFGISHLTICSFSVVLSLLTCLFTLRILLKRDIITSITGIATFVFLYWGGCSFAFVITSGRIDALAMLWTVLLVNEIIPLKDGSFWSKSKWPMIIYAFCLLSTSVASLPVFVLFCIFIWLCEKDRTIKRQLMQRFVCIFLAFLVSFACDCLFFYLNHSLFKFLNSFISFSATVSGDEMHRTFLQQALDAYLIDIEAIIIIFVSVLLLLIKKNRNTNFWLLLLFVAAIPLFMVAAGRYKLYYSWIMFIPSLTLLMVTLSLYKENKMLNYMMVILSFAILFIRPLSRINYYKEKRLERNQIIAFLDNNKDVFKEGDNVVFKSPQLYYPLVEKGVHLWHKPKKLEDIPRPSEKLNLFLDKKISDDNLKAKVKEIFHKCEYDFDYLPHDGYFIFEGIRDYNEKMEFLREHGYNVTIMSKYGMYSIARIKIGTNKID